MFNKNEITDVFFDLDHTLWDFEKNSALAYEKILKIHHIEIDLAAFLSIYVPNNLRYWRDYREGKITKELLRYQRLKSTFNELKFEISDEKINVLAEDYINYLATFTYLFDDCLEVLDYLYTKYKLHIITNGFAEVQAKKLKNSGIEKYFNVIMNSEDAGVKKPNLLIFEKALRAAQVRANHSVMIGDSYEADIQGAQNAGMYTLFFNPENKENLNNTIEIKTLKDIKSYL